MAKKFIDTLVSAAGKVTLATKRPFIVRKIERAVAGAGDSLEMQIAEKEENEMKLLAALGTGEDLDTTIKQYLENGIALERAKNMFRIQAELKSKLEGDTPASFLADDDK